MYAVTGITGQVGGAVARTLMAQGENVRAIARDASKAAPWVERQRGAWIGGVSAMGPIPFGVRRCGHSSGGPTPAYG